jgi:hypothetical protein
MTTRAQELIQWMSKVEQKIKAERAAIEGSSSSLQTKQRIAAQLLDQLASIFWGQQQSERSKLVAAYLSALLTVKLHADDLCTEGLEAALHPKGPNAKQDRTAADAIDKNYQSFIERWIVVSPLIDSRTFKNNETFLPKISNSIAAPMMRSASSSRLRGLGMSDGSRHPKETAQDAVARDLQLIRTSTQHSSVSAETDHLIGIVFLLAQLELKLRWANDTTDQFGVDTWYRAALSPTDVMRAEVLGIFDGALREAIMAGSAAEADRLLTARELNIVSMATKYSFRRQETRVLLTFFDKQNTTGRFAFQDDVVGVNGVEEKLFSYVGNDNPDVQESREAVSVSSVLAREKELLGGPVKVFGVIDVGRTRLEDELSGKSIDVDVPRALLGFQSSVRQNRRVVVGGKLSKPGALLITATSVIPHSEGYRALVAFPLRHAQTNARGELELTPSWRKMTDGLKRADAREREEHNEGVFSVPETLAGQSQLITDLLRDADVRKSLATGLKKKPLDLDMIDRDVRAKVWSARFADLAKQRQPPDSMRMLNAFIQSHLTYFTRHTYYNLRDSGKPYLASKWPTDLTGRHFYDCGVYAIETAYDLFRATRGVSGLKLEFRFLTFLNHLCLIVFFDNHSFLVNNGEITRPRQTVKSGTPTDFDRIDAAFKWGGQAFTTVYDVTYTMFLAVLPRLSLDTNRSDPAFKNGIWDMYQNSQGWGISNQTPVAQDYFEAIKLFNKASVRLAERIVELRDKRKESAPHWDEATKIALELYTLGERMTAKSNFIFFNTAFTAANPIPAVGFSIRPDAVTTKTKVTTLPMYELVEMLQQRKRDRRSLTTDQQNLLKNPSGFAHAAKLTELFRKP